MGCDIHAYIDYDAETSFVRNFAKIKIFRDYSLFGFLAGVRHDPKQFNMSLLVEPRGLPEKVSWQVADENSLVVLDQPENEDLPERACSKDSAEKWVKHGMSKWIDDNKKFVTNPDWHTHSYLYVDELKEIQKQLEKLREISSYFYSSEKELSAVISIMEKLNGDNPKCSRFIFWFDN